MKIWKLKVPPKIHMFLWKIENGVIPSKSFLKLRLHQDIDVFVKCVIIQSKIVNSFYGSVL